MGAGLEPSGSMVMMFPPASMITRRFTPLLGDAGTVVATVVVEPSRSSVAAGLVVADEPPVQATSTKIVVARSVRFGMDQGYRRARARPTDGVNSCLKTSDRHCDDRPIERGC